MKGKKRGRQGNNGGKKRPQRNNEGERGDGPGRKNRGFRTKVWLLKKGGEKNILGGKLSKDEKRSLTKEEKKKP